MDILKKVKIKLDRINKDGNNLYSLTDFTKLAIEHLYNFIVYQLYSVSIIFNDIKNATLRITVNNLILCTIEIDYFERLEYMYEDERGGLIRFSVINILNEILDSYNIGIAMPDTAKRYLIVLNIDNVNADEKVFLEKILEHIQKTLETYMSIAVSITVSPRRNGLENLPGMLELLVTVDN